MDWLKAHENYTVFGEAYGMQKNFPYDQKNGSVGLVLFDILDDHGQWLAYDDAREHTELPWVPTVEKFSFDFETCLKLAEGISYIPGVTHIREGAVIKPLVERFHATLGRVQLKVVSMGYLEKK